MLHVHAARALSPPFIGLIPLLLYELLVLLLNYGTICLIWLLEPYFVSYNNHGWLLEPYFLATWAFIRPTLGVLI
jgi:hypothetical protein